MLFGVIPFSYISVVFNFALFAGVNFLAESTPESRNLHPEFQKKNPGVIGETGAQWNTGYSGIFAISLSNMQLV